MSEHFTWENIDMVSLSKAPGATRYNLLGNWTATIHWTDSQGNKREEIIRKSSYKRCWMVIRQEDIAQYIQDSEASGNE
jgi:hypothetical protein